MFVMGFETDAGCSLFSILHLKPKSECNILINLSELDVEKYI
jgi:hypothetical protein